MAQDLESLLKEVFGEPLSRLTQFQSDQMKRLQARLTDIARESLKDEFTKLHSEIADLRSRVARLEKERVENAADSIEPLV